MAKLGAKLYVSQTSETDKDKGQIKGKNANLGRISKKTQLLLEMVSKKIDNTVFGELAKGEDRGLRPKLWGTILLKRKCRMEEKDIKKKTSERKKKIYTKSGSRAQIGMIFAYDARSSEKKKLTPRAFDLSCPDDNVSYI